MINSRNPTEALIMVRPCSTAWSVWKTIVSNSPPHTMPESTKWADLNGGALGCRGHLQTMREENSDHPVYKTRSLPF